MARTRYDWYVVCTRDRNDTINRIQAEQFLSCFYNRDAVVQALDGVRDMDDHVNLPEGYVIRRYRQGDKRLNPTLGCQRESE